MKIIKTTVIHGPNHWSPNQNKLIVLKLQLENQDLASTPDSILTALNKNSFFFENYTDKNFELLELLKYIATELQSQAGIKCSYINTKKADEKNQHYLIFSYTLEQTGTYTGRATIRIINSLIKNESYNIMYDIEELEYIKSDFSIGATTTYILEEVKKRNIPFRQFNDGSLTTLGYGCKQKKIRTAVTDSTSGLGIELAGDKEDTKKVLDEAHIPVPKGILIQTEAGLYERIGEVKFPLVVKPLNGNQGRGVTTNVNTIEGALFGFEIAKQVSDYVIIEEYIKGDDYRFLVINYKLVAVTKRVPASVTGNGRSTVKQLIDKENKNPQRGIGPEYVLALIKIDKVTQRILADKKITLDTVLPAGELLVLKDTANISAGGIAIDVTDKVHPENKFLAEHIARLFNLDICGIDIMSTAIDIPVMRDIGAVIEVNAGPGIRMHSNPQAGTPRNVAAPIIDMLFPNNASARIPIIAVFEDGDKSRITPLIGTIFKQAGYKPGYTSKEGIYLDGHLTYKENSTDFESAQDVLFDPMIDLAVLECDNQDISRSGLGFDHCNVSIVSTIPNESNTYSPEQMAQVIEVMLKSTYNNGYAILNADEDIVYNLKEKLDCNIALFSVNANNERIKNHCESGGLSIVLENTHFTLCRGKKKNNLINKTDLAPSYTFEKAIEILPALLTAVIFDLKTEVIISAINNYMQEQEPVAVI